MNFKKILAIGLLAVTAAATAHARTFDEVRNEGKIVIATEGQYPPYNFFKGAVLTGFEIELADAVARKWGVTVEWKALSFDGLLTGLRQDRWDLVIAGHAITAERSKSVTFTEPHFCGGGMVVARSAAIRELKDLPGKAVAVQTGTTFLEEAKKVPGLKDVKNFPQDTDARNALLSGRADAWVTDPAAARAAIIANPTSGLRLVGLLFVQRNAAVVAKGNTSLANAFSQAVRELQMDGTYVSLSKKYFGEDIRCK